MKRLMIIDALNAYFRAYIVDPSLSPTGNPIGGYKGFIKILQKLCREMKPDAIIVAWDGAGGSQRRKITNKNYKEGRKPIRLNRNVRNLTADEEMANKVWQQMRLMELLNQMPIIQLMIEGVEADDIIAHVSQSPLYRGWQKLIISSDKDFFQLCDEETILYRPIQKKFLNKNTIIEDFGIHPTNFAMARAVVGDKSDNLDGVPGVGLKTISKRFPFFEDEEDVTVERLLDSCHNEKSKLKVFENIINAENLIKDNYKIMQLYSPSISIVGKTYINETIETFAPQFNKMETIKRMIEDGFGDWNTSDLFSTFKRITISA